MKHFILTLSWLIICSVSVQTYAQKKKSSNPKNLQYQITFHLPGIPDSMLFVANYYGEHTYLRDTLFPSKKNPYTFVFEGKDTLKRGVYILASQNNAKYMEFLIDSSLFFTIQSNELDPKNLQISNNVHFINSPENDLFYEFTAYMVSKQIEGSSIRNKMKEEQEKPISDESLIESYKAQMSSIYDSMQSYTKQFIKNHPNNLFAKTQKFVQKIDIPDTPPEGILDSNWQYNYYVNHYWDNCDFSDEALVYTPVFAPRLAEYYDKVIVPAIDTIIKYSDLLIQKAENNPEMFKYIVWYLSSRFERSKYLGQDAVFVHIIKNYYAKGRCPWVDETVLENMVRRADILDKVLIGKTAPFLVMQDTAEKFHSNYELNVDYTIMWFWDTDCGHCKTATPLLKEFYNRAKDSLNFDIYAICLTSDTVKWKNYIKTNHLPWLNVGGNKANIDFREVYDIKSSPRIYLLDKDKTIIVKNIGVEELENFIINHKKGLIKF
jgi:thiol-disulfide isomerase/thioredoxin